MQYEGLRVTVMGLGHFGGGSAAARWLARAGARVTVTDTAPAEQLADSLQALQSAPIRRYQLGGHREADFRDADLIVVNPAIRPDNPWLEIAAGRGTRLTSEIELFLESCPARMVGVTGSNGKSTTAAMIASILEADGRRVYLGGNIGGSLLDDVGKMRRGDWVVLELSSFQLHRLNHEVRTPEVAVITNFTANHLNWHPDLSDYARSKQRLLVQQPSGGVAVFDRSAPGLGRWKDHVRGVHLEPDSEADLPRLLVCGRHNRTNGALAAAAARAAGCREDSVGIGLGTFRGLPDRLEPIGTVHGRRIINDSASTTPESTMAALEALDGPVWLLAGGADKGVDFDELARRIAMCAEGAVFYGQVGGLLAEKVAAQGAAVYCRAVETLEEALDAAIRQSPERATIVLSPGCSSHDQFANYRARGAAFTRMAMARRPEAA
ncbi:MAG: Mur ligase family protein [Thermoguttaceae bacterium]